MARAEDAAATGPPLAVPADAVADATPVQSSEAPCGPARDAIVGPAGARRPELVAVPALRRPARVESLTDRSHGWVSLEPRRTPRARRPRPRRLSLSRPCPPPSESLIEPWPRAARARRSRWTRSSGS